MGCNRIRQGSQRGGSVGGHEKGNESVGTADLNARFERTAVLVQLLGTFPHDSTTRTVKEASIVIALLVLLCGRVPHSRPQALLNAT